MKGRTTRARVKDNKGEALPLRRRSGSQVTRGGFWRVPREAADAISTTSDPLARISSLSFRIVRDEEET